MRNQIGQYTSVKSYWGKTKTYWLLLIAISLISAMVIDINGKLAAQDLHFAATYIPQDIIREYKYNEKVPKTVILEENKRVAELLNIDHTLTERIMKCESNFNNLAKNPNSTALGLSQYLIATWQETESFRIHRKARTDYKASIWEMGLDVANSEHYQKWAESRFCWDK